MTNIIYIVKILERIRELGTLSPSPDLITGKGLFYLLRLCVVFIDFIA